MIRTAPIALLAWAAAASGATPDDPGRIAVGHAHACAVREGRVHCWGGAACAERADIDCWTPVELPWLSGATELYARGDRTCAVDGAGDGWCWDAPRRGVSPWPEPTPVGAVRELAPPPAKPPTTPWGWLRALVQALRPSPPAPPAPPAPHSRRSSRDADHPSDAWRPELARHRAVWWTQRQRSKTGPDRPAEVCGLGPAFIDCWRDVEPSERERIGEPGWRHRRVDWPAVELVPGGELACGRDATGRVWCHRSRVDDFRSEPVTAPIGDAIGLAVGARFTCALLTDRSVRCWGRYHGDAPGRVVARDVDVVGIRYIFEAPFTTADAPATLAEHTGGATVTALAGGDRDGHALLSDGRVLDLDVVRWRDDNPGEPTRLPLVALRDAAQLVDGFGSTCALDRRGRIRCRPDTFEAGFGPPLTTGEPLCRKRKGCRPRGRPIVARGVAVVETRACKARWPRPWYPDMGNPWSRSLLWLDRRGRVHQHCAIDGGEYVDPAHAEHYDYETHGEPETRRFAAAYTAHLPALGRAEAIAGAGAALCLLRADGALDCRGWWVDDPRVGMRTLGARDTLWRAFPGALDLDTSAGLEVSPTHVCGLGADRRVRCAGWNLHGQLGAPAITDDVVPIALPGPPIPPARPTRIDGATRAAAAIEKSKAEWAAYNEAERARRRR